MIELASKSVGIRTLFFVSMASIYVFFPVYICSNSIVFQLSAAVIAEIAIVVFFLGVTYSTFLGEEFLRRPNYVHKVSIITYVLSILCFFIYMCVNILTIFSVYVIFSQASTYKTDVALFFLVMIGLAVSFGLAPAKHIGLIIRNGQSV